MINVFLFSFSNNLWSKILLNWSIKNKYLIKDTTPPYCDDCIEFVDSIPTYFDDAVITGDFIHALQYEGFCTQVSRTKLVLHVYWISREFRCMELRASVLVLRGIVRNCMELRVNYRACICAQVKSTCVGKPMYIQKIL